MYNKKLPGKIVGNVLGMSKRKELIKNVRQYKLKVFDDKIMMVQYQAKCGCIFGTVDGIKTVILCNKHEVKNVQ